MHEVLTRCISYVSECAKLSSLSTCCPKEREKERAASHGTVFTSERLKIVSTINNLYHSKSSVSKFITWSVHGRLYGLNFKKEMVVLEN